MATHFVKHFSIPRHIVEREAYIMDHCRNKRVLHVGCVDYVRTGDWRDLVTSGRWLHGQIRRVAAEVVGIDIAGEAVDELRRVYGMNDVYYGDAQDIGALGKGTFDVVIAGEILEHLPCPGLLLESAHPVMRTHGNLIVTTTNAFCARKLLMVAVGKESVHEDHLAYYSHRTLERLAEVYHYRVVEQSTYMIRNWTPLLPCLVEHFARLVSPNLVEGIICRMTPDK